MAGALSGAVTDMIAQGGVFVTAFLPVIGIVGGIGLAMWVLPFLRDYFRGA